MNLGSMLFPITLFLTASVCLGQTLGPSATEVTFQYSTEFVTDDLVTDSNTLASEHTQYLFGVMHSPALVQRFGIDPEQVGGIGSPMDKKQVKIISIDKSSGGQVKIRYKAKGKFMLHKKVAKAALKKGYMELPLPYDMQRIYDKNCTDPHYDTIGDYWYFWDPLTVTSCQYLAKMPLSALVKLKISESSSRDPDLFARLDLLRGSNGNGDQFSIYVIHGFAESSKSKKDEGRLNFLEFNDYLKGQGFVEDIENKTFSRPLHKYTKVLQLSNGNTINVEIKHLLVETSIESKGLTFAKFFKEAVETADVIVYGGHSGLGGNLDIRALEEKAGQFNFNKAKRQIFYFDSCSSYSYYLDQFAAEKTKSKIDVVTNGLSSYFHTSNSVLTAFTESLLTTEVNDLRWRDILGAMEAPLDGGSFLLNVGGL